MAYFSGCTLPHLPWIYYYHIGGSLILVSNTCISFTAFNSFVCNCQCSTNCFWAASRLQGRDLSLNFLSDTLTVLFSETYFLSLFVWGWGGGGTLLPWACKGHQDVIYNIGLYK